MPSPFNDTRIGRRQYLITYSQADAEKFPTRQSFGEMVADEFNSGKSKVKVQHWACCKEPHAEKGFHYHCALKLSGTKKWASVKASIMKKHNIVLHFSNSHDFYISAYRYLCKQDHDVYHSDNHPNLKEANSPRTKSTIAANKEAARKHRSETPSASSNVKKQKRLSYSDTAKLIRENNIHSYLELMAFAETRKQEGLNDVSEFVLFHSEKNTRELIHKTWLMQEAPIELAQRYATRKELLQTAASTPCIAGCNKQWLYCALEVLQLNNINQSEYSKSIRENLDKGRGKYRNVILVGPSNCAKTFLLKPLKVIFGDKLFENPANDKFAWVGADEATVMLLQDFRWNKDSITWKDLLLLLEGETVKFPAPKNIFSKDVIIKTNLAIFATSKSEIRYLGPYNREDPIEDEMMASRWKIYKFSHQFRESEQKQVPACARCFCELMLMD